jgi:disulfide bond formation protein DsbB
MKTKITLAILLLFVGINMVSAETLADGMPKGAIVQVGTGTTEDINTIGTTSSEEQLDVSPIVNENPEQSTGAYDFFGVSIWFWLVVALLVVLIIAILYMQSL